MCYYMCACAQACTCMCVCVCACTRVHMVFVSLCVLCIRGGGGVACMWCVCVFIFVYVLFLCMFSCACFHLCGCVFSSLCVCVFIFVGVQTSWARCSTPRYSRHRPRWCWSGCATACRVEPNPPSSTSPPSAAAHRMSSRSVSCVWLVSSLCPFAYCVLGRSCLPVQSVSQCLWSAVLVCSVSHLHVCC